MNGWMYVCMFGYLPLGIRCIWWRLVRIIERALEQKQHGRADGVDGTLKQDYAVRCAREKFSALRQLDTRSRFCLHLADRLPSLTNHCTSRGIGK